MEGITFTLVQDPLERPSISSIYKKNAIGNGLHVSSGLETIQFGN
jgi:hypothetical protein